MTDTTTLGDVCDLIVDCEHKTAPTAGLGKEYGYSVGTPHIQNGRILLGYAKRVDEETYRQWTARVTPEVDDLILAREAPVGQVGRIAQGQRICLGQRTVLLRPNRQAVNPGYIHYLLLSPLLQKTMASMAAGSTVSHLNVQDIRILPLPKLPDVAQQANVSAALEALDDKIAVNESIATTTDEILRVSFARALVRTPEEFVEQPLSRVAEFVNGRAFTKAATGRGRMVIRIAEINSGPGVSTVYNEIDVPERHLARPGDVLFAWSGSLTVARWYRSEAIINQHIFKVIPKDNIPLWLVFELVGLKLAEFRAIAAGKATTMGHIQRRHLDEPVPMPTTRFLLQLDAQLKPLWDCALAAEQETLALAALRDTLLPQLMSGKLRVRDAERIVEDTVWQPTRTTAR